MKHKRKNPAMERLEAKRLMAAMILENETTLARCCTRWFLLTLWALIRMGWGRKRIDDFMQIFNQCTEEATQNDTWEDEVIAMLGRRLEMPAIDYKSVLEVGRQES